MSYGIEILNNNDRIVIDINYANFGLVSDNLSSATPSSTYPGLAGVVNSDLVIARTNAGANGSIARSINPATAWSVITANPTRYYVIRRFDSLNPTTSSGYGFAVYNPSSNVIFSSNVAKNFEVVTVGVFNSSVSATRNISFPSSSTLYSNLDKYYVVANPTYYFSFSTFVSLNIYTSSYRYVWANSTHGRIVLESYSSTTTSGTTTYTNLNRDVPYMILKELS